MYYRWGHLFRVCFGLHVLAAISLSSHLRAVRPLNIMVVPRDVSTDTVRFHSFISHNFNLRVSNPRDAAYVNLEMPFESSNIPGAGPFFQFVLLKTSHSPTRCFEEYRQFREPPLGHVGFAWGVET